MSNDLVKRTGGPRPNTTRGVLVGVSIGLTIGVMGGAIAIAIVVGVGAGLIVGTGLDRWKKRRGG